MVGRSLMFNAGHPVSAWNLMCATADEGSDVHVAAVLRVSDNETTG